MNELSRHIEILLLNNDCVIVPGFGGFMAHHRPAEYVDEAGMFYPPQRTLGFNSQLRLNDSLLAQSYVEAYDISYPEAVRRIEEEVAEIKQTISIEGAYEFHGIGTIKQNSSEIYDFEPCTAGLLTPELYALNSFAIDLLAQPSETAEIPLEIHAVNTKAEQTPKEETVEDKSEEGTEEYNERTIEIRLHTLRNIMAAAMVLLLFIFSSIPAGVGSNKVITCSVLDTELITSFIKASAFNADMAEPLVTDTAAKTTSEPREEVENTQAADVTDGKFFIVMASKVTKSGAENFIAQLADAGYKEARMIERGSMRKVVYGRYATSSDANEALHELRKENDAFAEAWISNI